MVSKQRLPGRIVFADLPRVPGPFHLYISATDGSHRTLVAAPPKGGNYYHPKFSPDGGRILFDRTLVGHRDSIMVVNADGSDLRMVTHGCTGSCLGDGHPAWSPDGTQIAFERAIGTIRQGTSCCVHASIGIWVAHADGSQPRQLTQFKLGSGWEDHSPSFSPDGRQLLFMRDGNKPGNLDQSSIWTIGVDGKHPRLVYRLPHDRPGGGGNARWSPDGSRILFTDACLFDTCRPAPTFEPQVLTIRHDGTELHQLTQGPGGALFPAWSPDGQWIVFSRSVSHQTAACHGQPQHELYVMKANGTDIRRITTSTPNGCDPIGPDWG